VDELLSLPEIAGRCRAVCCYIAEAHAVDEWPVPSARFNGSRGVVTVSQPKTAQARCALARQFAADFRLSERLPLLVDDPTDEAFERAYAPWPLRLFLVGEDGRLIWLSEPDGDSFDGVIGELRALLLRLPRRSGV